MTQQPIPKNHLAAAILCTIFCCTPTGIVAIIKAARVNNLYCNGNYDEACRCANEAKKWTIISIILGVIATIIFVAVQIHK